MAKIPIEDTEPHVQRLFDGSYLERDMGSQGPADVGLCVSNYNYYKNMIYILLSIIAVLLYLLYGKIKEIYNIFLNESEDDYSWRDDYSFPKTVSSKLNKISTKTSNIEYYLKSDFLDFITSENPAGANSAKYKRLNNLIKLYTQHLVKYEKMNENYALIKARFCVYCLGHSEIPSIIMDIDRVYERDEKEKSEKEFYKSEFFKKEIKDFGIIIEEDGTKSIPPYYLFSPIYDLIKKQEKYEADKVIKWAENETNYSEVVQNCAIISNLEKIGIIKKINGSSLITESRWIIPSIDMSKIKEKIYGGKDSDDDDFFDGQFLEGKLERIFEVDIFHDDNRKNENHGNNFWGQYFE